MHNPRAQRLGLVRLGPPDEAARLNECVEDVLARSGRAAPVEDPERRMALPPGLASLTSRLALTPLSLGRPAPHLGLPLMGLLGGPAAALDRVRYRAQRR